MSLTQKPAAFVDQEYSLGDPKILLDFNKDDMYQLSLAIDCGPTKITFRQNDEPMLDTTIFDKTETDTQFIIQKQSVKTTIGSYDIYYEIELENFANVKADYQTQFNEPAFNVMIVDAGISCDLLYPQQGLDLLCGLPPEDCTVDCPADQLPEQTYEGSGYHPWFPDSTTIIDATNLADTNYQINGAAGCATQPGAILTSCQWIVLNGVGAEFISFDSASNTIRVNQAALLNLG